MRDKYEVKSGAGLSGNSNHREWFRNGKRHRVDGPAVDYGNGYVEWWRNGKRHREDGPAVEYGFGSPSWHREWYVHGKKLSKKEFDRRKK